jgi:PAS domain S-box-containing protein
VDREEALTLTVRDLSSPESRFSDLSGIWKKAMAGEKQLFEWKARRPADGSVFDVELFLSSFEAQGRKLILAAVRDITDRKRAEEALRRSEALLKEVLETMPVGVWITDAGGRIIHGNAAARSIWGDGRYVGIERFGEYRGWWLPSGKRIEPEEWAAARAVRKGEASINEEVEIETFEGVRKIILNSAVPIRDEHGQVTGAIIVNQDITDRKRIEDAVRREGDRARQYLNVARVIIVAVEADQRVSLINQKGCEMLGYAEEEIVGRNWFDHFIPEGQRDEVKKVFAGLVRGELEVFESHENPVLTRNGGLRLISWHNSIIRNEEGCMERGGRAFPADG